MSDPLDNQVEALIGELEDAWDFEDPATPEELAEAEQAVGGPLPEVLAAFFRRAYGAEIGPVDVFINDEFVDVNRRRPPGQKGAVYFASDGGDGFFLIDAANQMKRGKEAIFWADRASSSRKRWVHVADDLLTFLRRVAAGETPWLAPTVSDVSLQQMIQRLEAARDRWSGKPPAVFEAVREAGKRIGILVPQELEELFEVTSGLEIPGAGLRLFGPEGLGPVEGTAKAGGRPGAIWFGEDDQGNRYALTTMGWRDSEGGDVMRVGPGESPASAAILGPLPAVMVSWLERGNR